MREKMPRLSGDELRTWNFYARNASRFVQDFNLMPSLINRSELEGISFEIFIERLNAIHEAVLSIAERKAQFMIEKKDTIFAEERT